VRLVLVGPPGAGKGTQAQFVAEHLSVPNISTGDIFRANVGSGTPLGTQAKTYMDRGDLVPDDVTIAMVRDRLAEDDARQGFLLDGFPRTVPQAESLDDILRETAGAELDVVLELVVEDEEVIRRLSGRRTCGTCNRIWHVEFDAPQVEGVCDADAGELFQREDDKAETVANRLNVYADQTAPLVAFYSEQGKLVRIDATGAVEDITARALDALRTRAPRSGG
jgi:adenylate kinase